MLRDRALRGEGGIRVNVLEAIENMTTIMEAMQEHRKQQDAKIKRLERRADIYEAVLAFVALVALLAVVFFS